MANWETALIAAGEHTWLLVVVVIVVSVARTRPVQAVGWVLSNEIRDRYLRWKHVPDDERLRLIKHGAELEVDQGPRELVPAAEDSRPGTGAQPGQ